MSIRKIAKQFHLKSLSFNIPFTTHGRRSESLNLAVMYSIECVRCHAIENKIKNYASDKVKKLWYCRQ